MWPSSSSVIMVNVASVKPPSVPNRTAASRPFFREVPPSDASDRLVRVGLGTRTNEDAFLLLYRLSYALPGDGTRTRNLKVNEGTPTYASGRLECQGTRQRQRHRGGDQDSNPVLLVKSQAWYRFHHLA
jgi:hypothetical protein